MVGHVTKNPVGIPLPARSRAAAQRVARILAVGRTHALRAVDHREDAARLEQDGVR